MVALLWPKRVWSLDLLELSMHGAAAGATSKLSPNTILVWMKKTISLAYEVAGKDEELTCLHSIRAQESHAFSASWDALRSMSVEGIMAACQ